MKGDNREALHWLHRNRARLGEISATSIDSIPARGGKDPRPRCFGAGLAAIADRLASCARNRELRAIAGKRDAAGYAVYEFPPLPKAPGGTGSTT